MDPTASDLTAALQKIMAASQGGSFIHQPATGNNSFDGGPGTRNFHGSSQHPSHPNTTATDYSWDGVMDFLKKQKQQGFDPKFNQETVYSQSKQGELMAEKRALTDRVKILEEQLQKQINANKDLVAKVHLLEFKLRQNTSKRGTFVSKNPVLVKGVVHHQRGNSDGIQNLAHKIVAHHTRGSSGSNGQLRTFEDNLDASQALLNQTLDDELNKQSVHQKTHSGNSHEPAEVTQ